MKTSVEMKRIVARQCRATRFDDILHPRRAEKCLGTRGNREGVADEMGGREEHGKERGEREDRNGVENGCQRD